MNKKTDKFLNRYKTISDKWCKMNKKLVGTIIAVVLIGVLMAGCVDESAPDKTPTPKPAATPEPIQTPKPTVAPTPAVKPPAQMTTGCDMCHKTESTAELQAHVKGAQSCMGSEIGDCHSGEKYGGADANVHTIHPASAVGCAGCHGKIPTIPQNGPQGTSCEQCHGLPNPLDPSEGRLVEVHLERGRDCAVCHVGEISQIHGLQ